MRNGGENAEGDVQTYKIPFQRGRVAVDALVLVAGHVKFAFTMHKPFVTSSASEFVVLPQIRRRRYPNRLSLADTGQLQQNQDGSVSTIKQSRILINIPESVLGSSSTQCTQNATLADIES